MRVLGIVIAAALGGVALGAQVSPLDRPLSLDSTSVLVPVEAAEAYVVATTVARAAAVPIGFEQTSPLPVQMTKRQR